MGKGDRRTRRGKIFSGSYGKARAQKSDEPTYQKTPAKEGGKVAATKAPAATPKKTPVKRTKASS